MARFKQVTIVGLGLIGGSLGMAIRRRRLAERVIGVSRTEATFRRAKRRGAVDAGTTDPEQAVRGADLVVLATPVDVIVPYAKRLARRMRPGSILTDVGSTKAAIVEALDRALPCAVAFVGGHPIAGSEERGFDAACAELFTGSACVLTPTRATDRRALHRVASFWRPLVGCVVTMSPRRHDELLASTSHLAHLVAFSLAHSLDTHSLPFVPPSFLEMTRVAKSPPDLWDDILLSNRSAVLAAAGRFTRQWRALRAILSRRDRRALRRFLTEAKSSRDALPHS